jgi:hypothetical protein
VDLESAMTASTITPSSHPSMPGGQLFFYSFSNESMLTNRSIKIGLDENNPMHHHQMMLLEQRGLAPPVGLGRKRGASNATSPVSAAMNTRSKRTRRSADPPPPTHHPPPEPPREPQEKPDANMCLKVSSFHRFF